VNQVKVVLVSADEERKRAEESQTLMVRELHHRVKNTLATRQAAVSSTARTAGTIV
jgi:two-component sensor histidine kinase